MRFKSVHINKHSSYIPIIFVVISISLTGCDNNQNNQENVQPNSTNQVEQQVKKSDSQQKVIMFFGNSLTAGYGLDEGEDYPSLIQNRLDSMELNYSVINAGVSGETSSGGVSRIDWVLRQKIDIFLLELGANDMLRGLDVTSTEENLSKILTTVRETYPNTKLIIAGMQAPPNMGQSYVNAFNSIFAKLAGEFNAELIPFFLEGVAGNDSLNLDDGKHPNEQGQKIVMDNVWRVLFPLL